MSDANIINRLLVKPQIIYVCASTWYMYNPSVNKVFSCKMNESTKSNSLNHAVLLVGYTETSWIIKNSWGTGFGQSGYIEVSRSASANCGVGFMVAST